MCQVLLLLISFLLLILLQVWFLEEEKLPVVSSSLEGQNKYKILMKSPWEILQSPVGSGGFISLFSKHGITDNLINMGVEYLEVRLSFAIH
jgi:UDP-N-acetylglucosamine pyrophosphorylase